MVKAEEDNLAAITKELGITYQESPPELDCGQNFLVNTGGSREFISHSQKSAAALLEIKTVSPPLDVGIDIKVDSQG